MGHRLDIHFSDNFQIGLIEMATYGGPDRSPEFAFFNLLTFYYPTQRNDRKLMSGLWAIDAFYKPVKKISLYGQFLIDDIIVNNEPGIDDRAQYDDRFGLMLSVRTGDLIQGLNTDITYT